MRDGETEASVTSDSRYLAGRPLAGRTIIITRAAAQAGKFTAALERYGARVVACPVIEIVDPESYEPLDEAIDNLYGYDWLIFTSVNGVDYFLRRLMGHGLELSELKELRVCAIGDATAERLAAAHVHTDVVPNEFKAEGVFASLVSYLGGQEKLSGLNFLIPRAAVARDYLPRELEKAGARVDVVAAYRTMPPKTVDRARIEAMISGGGVDCITFTSSSTVTNFARLFDTTDLSKLLAGVRVACIGDITARSAAQYGLHTDIQPQAYTTADLARAVAAYYGALPTA